MKKSHLVTIFLLLTIKTALAGNESNKPKLEEIRKLSEESLGLSINSLSFLVSVSKHSFHKFDVMMDDFKLAAFLELDQQSFIKLERHIGLPDGKESSTIFYHVKLTDKGTKTINDIREVDNIPILNSSSRTEIVAMLQNSLRGMNEQISALEAQEIIGSDLNEDGVKDIFFEKQLEINIEKYDRNFDGNTDEKWVYDLSNKLISGTSDDNFNGFFETKYTIKDGSVEKQFVDSDQNGVFDIVYYYKHGVWDYSEKYYSSGEKRIGRIQFGIERISATEEFKATKITELEFQNERMN